MEVVVPQEMAAAIDRLREVLEERFISISANLRTRPEQNYFTRDEAAEYLRMSPRMLDNLTDVGEIRRAKLGQEKKSKVLFRRVDLDAYVESQLELDREAAKRFARNL